MDPRCRLLVPVLLLGFGTLLAAQSRLVHPPLFENKIGQTATYHLLRSYPTQAENQSRYVQIHDLGASLPLRIRGMALRFATYSDMDAYFRYQAFTADLSLSLSTSPTPAAGMTDRLSANIGPDAVEVIARTTLHFPAKTGPSPTLPAPFAYRLPFDVGKSFLLAPGRSLAWELRVHDNGLFWSGSTHLLVDTAYLTTVSANAYYGKGSAVPGSHPRFGHYGHLYNNYNALIGTHSVYGTAHYGPPSGVAFLLLGLDRAPLPGLPLGPQATLYLEPTRLVGLLGPYPLDFRGNTFTTSSASPFAATPHEPGMEGVHIHGQWISFSPTLDGPYTTSGILLQFPLWASTNGLDLGLSRCYRSGNTAFTDVSGTLGKDIGVVVEFTL